MLSKPKNVTAAQWVAQVQEEGGVLAALPCHLWPPSQTRQLAIGRLPGDIGKANWWSRKRPTQGNGFEDWFPESAACDPEILSLEWDRLTLAGMSYQQFAKDGVLVQLEAAARGIAPAICAHFVDSGYTQLHSFRLGDMLHAFNRLMGDPLRRPSKPAFEGTIYEATAAIARKVRSLADARIIKLDMTARDVVFCPKLHEAENGNLEEHGYGYDGLQTIKGIPYINGFNGRFCKKIPQSSTGYDADCAYLLMMLVLVADVKAAYGLASSKLMLHKILGKTTSGADLPIDELIPDFEGIGLARASRKAGEGSRLSDFCASLKSALLSYEEGDPGPHMHAFQEQTTKDLKDIVESQALESLWHDKAQIDPARKFFAVLVGSLQDSTEVSTDIFNPAVPTNETLDALERIHHVERRLMAVVGARVQNVSLT